MASLSPSAPSLFGAIIIRLTCGPSTKRHNAIRDIIAKAFNAMGQGTKACTEPSVPGTNRRHDIRVTDGEAVGVTPRDYEIKVFGALTTTVWNQYQLTGQRPFPKNYNPLQAALTRIEQNVLDRQARPAPGFRAPPLTALVFSSGGEVGHDTLNAFKSIRRHLKPSTFTFITRLISFSLVRFRAASFSTS